MTVEAAGDRYILCLVSAREVRLYLLGSTWDILRYCMRVQRNTEKSSGWHKDKNHINGLCAFRFRFRTLYPGGYEVVRRSDFNFYMYGVQYIVLTCIFLHASWQLKHSPTSIGRNEKVVQLLCELPGEPCWWIRALEQRETCPHVLLPTGARGTAGKILPPSPAIRSVDASGSYKASRAATATVAERSSPRSQQIRTRWPRDRCAARNASARGSTTRCQ